MGAARSSGPVSATAGPVTPTRAVSSPGGEGGHHRRVDAQQEQHDQGADDERPALDPRRELAPGDERHGAQGAVHAAAPGASDGAGVPVSATVSR